MSEPLTKGIYHINIAKQYFKAFKIECRQQAKLQADSWVKRIEWIENDVYGALTPQGKELFKQEIANGDTLFYENVSEMIMKMDDKQRELVERLCESILKGETIEFIEPQNKY